jgi:MYXO-CTERM domain-containing protein
MQFNSNDWGRHDEFCLPSVCEADLHDVGWVRLPQSVDIPPILPITDQAEFDEAMVPGTELVFVGYGLTEDNELGVKREVAATLTSFNESGREFFAGGDGKDTCAGDSGGPALVALGSGEIRLAGVLSRGAECGTGGTYSVPAPELCWLRDSSGVDLLPAGCGCDCVSLYKAVLDDGCACAVGARGSSVSAPRSNVVMMLGLLAVALFVRRRRC